METHSKCWHPLQNENSFQGGGEFLNLGSKKISGNTSHNNRMSSTTTAQSALVPWPGEDATRGKQKRFPHLPAECWCHKSTQLKNEETSRKETMTQISVCSCNGEHSWRERKIKKVANLEIILMNLPGVSWSNREDKWACLKPAVSLSTLSGQGEMRLSCQKTIFVLYLYTDQELPVSWS